ncbi:MAG: hypothetical protein KDD48_07890 [Bdellovibrionales bacterium]|nr:hypothetical protein [Bdellovibrionales bacterium]
MSVATIFNACGGGGGGSHGGGTVLYYPYENVYGDVCSTYSPTPGCTFDRSTGLRVITTDSIDGSLVNMWTVKFDLYGTATVKDQYGNFIGYYDVSDFDGYQGGTVIGVGTTGVFWEDVAGGSYYWDSNGVLFSDNYYESNYLEAINNVNAGDAVDVDYVAMNDEANQGLVAKAAQKLQAKYGFQKEKANAVAAQLNRWGLGAVERGYSTAADIKATFQSTFGVDLDSAVAAAVALKAGDKSKMIALTNRSANALGISPRDAEAFLKDSYSDGLASFGYSQEEISGLDW